MKQEIVRISETMSFSSVAIGHDRAPPALTQTVRANYFGQSAFGSKLITAVSGRVGIWGRR